MTVQQRRWLPWLLLAIAAVVSTLPFWLTDLDIRAAAHFYTPAPFDLGYSASWPQGNAGLFKTLYDVGSALSWLVLLASMLIFVLPQFRRRPLTRQVALTTLATIALGTGLLVNALGKDFTGRPRPRTIEQFQGHSQYLRPLELGTPGVGKSFPCGHCSAGFAVGSVGLAVLAARPALGTGLIVFSFLLGGAIGSARMAAGGHFLSDVMWSAILTWVAALTAHTVIVRANERGTVLRWPPWLRNSLLGALGVAVAMGLLFVRPFHKRVDVSLPMPAAEASLPVLKLDLDAGDIDLRIDPSQVDALRLRGEVKGLGFPNTHIKDAVDASQPGAWQYRLQRVGRSNEIEAPMTLTLRPEAVSKLDLRIRLGSLQLPPGGDAAIHGAKITLIKSSGKAPGHSGKAAEAAQDD